MKKRIMLAAVFAVSGMILFGDVSGYYNTWLGWLAGKDAIGSLTTDVGAGAGGEAYNTHGVAYIGTAAGMRSTNVADSVAAGYGALAYAMDCSNVVAIGRNAMLGASNALDVTAINGQFYASGQAGRFYVKASPATPDAEAPIYYANGNLYLNAERIYTSGGGAISGGGESSGYAPSGSSDGWPTNYDWYVSTQGNDAYDGKSASSPFRTLDHALSAASTNDTICVAAGEYDWPTFFATVESSTSHGAPYPVMLYAVSGADRTIIKSGNGRNQIHGRESAGTYFRGFTFLGVTAQTGNNSGFADATFDDCRFAGIRICAASLSSAAVWTGVTFRGCQIADCVITSEHHTVSSMAAPTIFMRCELLDTIVDIDTEGGMDYGQAGDYPELFWCCFVSNSFVCAGRTDKPPYGASSYRSKFVDSTVCITDVMTSASWLPDYMDCLIGVGTNTVPSSSFGTHELVRSVCTNAAIVSASLGSDHRARSPVAWRWLGYGSVEDRAYRDALSDSLMQGGFSLRFEAGEFQVLTNGIKAGTLAFTPDFQN